jgi:hypothetical protein
MPGLGCDHAAQLFPELLYVARIASEISGDVSIFFK